MNAAEDGLEDHGRPLKAMLAKIRSNRKILDK